MQRSALVLALTLTTLALAGCIDVPGGDEPVRDPPSGSSDGAMTAKEEKAENTAACVNGGPGFCATRTITVTGTVGGFALFETTLSTFNGRVSVAGGSGDDWRMVATLKARGSTPDSAKAALDDIEWSWSHERGAAHFLEAAADYDGRGDDDANRGADIEVVLPKALVLRLVAESVNGPVEVKGVRTDGLSASTVNGQVNVEADVTQASLHTVNGQVEARLNPTGPGRISAETVNGQVDLRLPEDATHGYDLVGRTTNGEVDIGLRDGEVGPCPQGSQYYTPPCNERSFRTSGYDARSIRTTVTLAAVNGGVEVQPA